MERPHHLQYQSKFEELLKKNECIEVMYGSNKTNKKNRQIQQRQFHINPLSHRHEITDNTPRKARQNPPQASRAT